MASVFYSEPLDGSSLLHCDRDVQISEKLIDGVVLGIVKQHIPYLLSNFRLYEAITARITPSKLVHSLVYFHNSCPASLMGDFFGKVLSIKYSDSSSSVRTELSLNRIDVVHNTPLLPPLTAMNSCSTLQFNVHEDHNSRRLHLVFFQYSSLLLFSIAR